MYNLSMFKRSENIEVLVQPNGIMVIINNPYEAGEPSEGTITIEIDSDDESCAMHAFDAHLRDIRLMDNIHANALETNAKINRFQNFGVLAKKWCRVDLQIQPCKSNAGWFVGTLLDSGEPCARESEQYYARKQECEYALDNNMWTQRSHP